MSRRGQQVVCPRGEQQSSRELVVAPQVRGSRGSRAPDRHGKDPCLGYFSLSAWSLHGLVVQSASPLDVTIHGIGVYYRVASSLYRTHHRALHTECSPFNVCVAIVPAPEFVSAIFASQIAPPPHPKPP